MKTSNLADLLPIYGAWTGTTEPSVLLRSGSGALLKFDPFDSEFTNSNMLISGGSGSGKSFLTNIILMQMLKENPKIFFVDIGGSYKKLCENLEGQYLPLGVSEGIAINPFDLAPGEEAVSNQKIKFLVGLIELMAKEEDVSRLPKLERAEVEEAIREVYATSKAPRLSDLQRIFLNHKDPSINRFGKILAPWCGDSLFGKFLDQQTNISLDKQVVAFDLKGMETYPELQAVCLFLITDLVWREVQKDRLTKNSYALTNAGSSSRTNRGSCLSRRFSEPSASTRRRPLRFRRTSTTSPSRGLQGRCCQTAQSSGFCFSNRWMANGSRRF
ncbi:MAG: hypothetical protein HC883_04920 [Bdellovibrionaceae bacterium]|nr:hypothetical protein [Pseudobdellovibrionaceae bacterium]